MKRCPVCQRTYADQTLKFCRFDRATLVGDSSTDSDTTVDLSVSKASLETSRQVALNTRLPASAPSIAVLPFVNMSADQ